MNLEIKDKLITGSTKYYIKKFLQQCKSAHYIDIKLRINGKDVFEQADWLKYIEVKQ